MRSLLALVLSLGFAFPAAAARGESHRIGVSAMVMARMKLHLHDHPASLQVSAADLKRGFVVVTGPRIEAGSNDRRSMTLQVRLAPGVASEVRIEGLASGIHAQGEQASVPLPPASPAEPARPVSYHITFAEHLQPGTYAWPIALSMHGHP